MKASHYKTPRTLNDATFQLWGEAIERIPTGIRISTADVLWACITGIFAALFLAHWVAS